MDMVNQLMMTSLHTPSNDSATMHEYISDMCHVRIAVRMDQLTMKMSIKDVRANMRSPPNHPCLKFKS